MAPWNPPYFDNPARSPRRITSLNLLHFSLHRRVVPGRPFRFLHALLTRSVAPTPERRFGPPCGCMIRSNYDGTNLDTFPRKAFQSH